MSLSPDEQVYYDEKTGKCKNFVPKDGQKLVINVEESFIYEYHNRNACFKGNSYAPYCAFCAKELCLYWKPEVNLVPEGQGETVILDKYEVEQIEQKKANNM